MPRKLDTRRITRVLHKGRVVRTLKDKVTHDEAVAQIGENNRLARFLGGETIVVRRTVLKSPPSIAVEVTFVPAPMGRGVYRIDAGRAAHRYVPKVHTKGVVL